VNAPFAARNSAGSASLDGALVELRNVTVDFVSSGGFRRQRKIVRAVDDVSLAIDQGQTLGLVGGTGSGKSTIAHLVMGMVEPTDGTIMIAGADPRVLTGRGLLDHRRRVQVVLQDPYSSLDPRMRVRDLIAEPLTLGGRRSKAVDARVEELLLLVGLPPAKASLYPHQFSGGQRQRIAIARALAPRPEIVVLDEPTSALDVSVRAQIINLLNDLQAQLGVTYLVISHDLVTVACLASKVAVMYPGRIVEIGPTKAVYQKPQHPYTLLLHQSAPDLEGNFLKVKQPQVLAPRAEGMWAPEQGCRYRSRCVLQLFLGEPSRCRSEEPTLREVAPGHAVACHFAEKTSELAAVELDQAVKLAARNAAPEFEPAVGGSTAS
jgi:peptide/nickel transport system ATP-binding protein